MPDERLMSFEDVAREANLPLSTVYYFHRTGKGPEATVLGRHLRVTRQQFEDWLTRQKS